MLVIMPASIYNMIDGLKIREYDGHLCLTDWDHFDWWDAEDVNDTKRSAVIGIYNGVDT